MADTAGLEPAASHCADIVVDAAGALPFKSYASCDSFPDYRLGNQTQGCTDTLLLTAKVSGFEVAQTPTVFFRERLLLALKGSGRFAATGSGLLCGLGQLSLLVLVRSTVPGRLKGFLVVGVGPSRHKGFHPLSAASCGKR